MTRISDVLFTCFEYTLLKSPYSLFTEYVADFSMYRYDFHTSVHYVLFHVIIINVISSRVFLLAFLTTGLAFEFFFFQFYLYLFASLSDEYTDEMRGR